MEPKTGAKSRVNSQRTFMFLEVNGNVAMLDGQVHYIIIIIIIIST